jgi:peptide/nickel transport system permease protein
MTLSISPDPVVSQAQLVGEVAPAPADAPSQRMKRGRSISVVVAFAWLAAIVLLALLAPILPLSRYDIPIGPPKLRPGLRWPEFMGTDELGRSMLSRLIHGARASLTVGLLAVGLATTFGALLGLLAGYKRGRVDAVVSFAANVGLAFPALILLLALTAVLEPSITSLVIALALVFTPPMIRVSRASAMSVANREFVSAAYALGSRPRRIVFREILPNTLAPISTVAFVSIATVIVAEGSLSFLGLGLAPPTPSWGGMIASGRRFLSTDAYLVFVPAAMLILTVISIQVLGDWARRRYERRESQLG